MIVPFYNVNDDQPTKLSTRPPSVMVFRRPRRQFYVLIQITMPDFTAASVQALHDVINSKENPSTRTTPAYLLGG